MVIGVTDDCVHVCRSSSASPLLRLSANPSTIPSFADNGQRQAQARGQVHHSARRFAQGVGKAAHLGEQLGSLVGGGQHGQFVQTEGGIRPGSRH